MVLPIRECTKLVRNRMLPFKKILFPVDFSQHSMGAAHYAEAFAGRFDADLTVLHVVTIPKYNDLRPSSPAEERAHLEEFLAKELEYFRVHRVLAHGDPATEVLKVAKAQHSDLIMMPTLGSGGFRRFLLGSVTAKVLHDADCPVWTGVHLEQAPPLEKIVFRNFLCAVNLDPHNAHYCTCIVPPEAAGVSPGRQYRVADLVTGATYLWSERNYVRLDPSVEPAHILRIEARL